jgi:hypothetical protein
VGFFRWSGMAKKNAKMVKGHQLGKGNAPRSKKRDERSVWSMPKDGMDYWHTFPKFPVGSIYGKGK